jgi:hypothetical protein
MLGDNSPETVKANEWVKGKFTKGNVPPFSFVYDGKLSRLVHYKWDYKRKKLSHPKLTLKNIFIPIPINKPGWL